MSFLNMTLCHTYGPCTSKVDILGFKHLNLELSISRVEVIRDAILELMGNELGANLTQEMTTGILRVLNYIGGALIYIRSHFADRVKILSESWEEANRERDQTKQKAEGSEGKGTARGVVRDCFQLWASFSAFSAKGILVVPCDEI